MASLPSIDPVCFSGFCLSPVCQCVFFSNMIKVLVVCLWTMLSWVFRVVLRYKSFARPSTA